MEDYVREQDHILHRRRNNVLIYNVPESDKEAAGERQDEDARICTDVFENCLEVKTTRIHKIIRLGGNKIEGGNRPILVTLDSEDKKYKILRNAKKLKNQRDPTKKAIGISPDLTKKQREKDYKLRQELRQRREQGEEGLYIKNGNLYKARGEQRSH